jgi:hypothetical protein
VNTLARNVILRTSREKKKHIEKIGDECLFDISIVGRLAEILEGFVVEFQIEHKYSEPILNFSAFSDLLINWLSNINVHYPLGYHRRLILI